MRVPRDAITWGNILRTNTIHELMVIRWHPFLKDMVECETYKANGESHIVNVPFRSIHWL